MMSDVDEEVLLLCGVGEVVSSLFFPSFFSCFILIGLVVGRSEPRSRFASGAACFTSSNPSIRRSGEGVEEPVAPRSTIRRLLLGAVLHRRLGVVCRCRICHCFGGCSIEGWEEKDEIFFSSSSLQERRIGYLSRLFISPVAPLQVD